MVGEGTMWELDLKITTIPLRVAKITETPFPGPKGTGNKSRLGALVDGAGAGESGTTPGGFARATTET